MKRMIISMFAAVVAATTFADTVAWWHFDEEAPGTTANSGVVTESISGTTATSYWINSNSVQQTSSPYRPAFGPAFTSLVVYDPVSGTTNANRSAMKFVTARGGPNPSGNSGRAYYGGAFKVTNDTLYTDCTGALTVEAFVCTTGGVYNSFAPIIGCLANANWTGEKWAIYMETNGTIAVRFNGSVWWSNNKSGQDNAGKAKINDGYWHHVALTWDGSTIKIYVDYAIDKKASNSSERTYSKDGTIDYSGTATWIGGYGTYDLSNGGRKFPGLIDEIRVSSGALTPDKFLRLVPPTEDDADTVLHLRFDSDAARALEDGEVVGGTIGGLQAIYNAVAGADASSFNTVVKAGDVMADCLCADGVADVASYSQATNEAAKSNFIKVANLTNKLFPSGVSAPNCLDYTVEAFFKFRSTSPNRQSIFKIGSGSNILVAQAITGDAGFPHQLQFAYRTNTVWKGITTSASKPVDDGNWHHIAFVSDAARDQILAYYDYALVESRTGATPDVPLGYSIFIGANESKAQFFDGWIDDVRVMKRALRPEEFLTTHPVGSATPNPLFFAGFENNYDFTCAPDNYWSVSGRGVANTSAGNVPTFEKTSPGALLLDGTNGSERVVNDYSVQLNKSYVEMPVSPLYEQRAFTVEFWAKFTGFIDNNGEHDGTYANLPYHAGILRFNRDSGSEYDWFFYRVKDNAKGMQIAVRNAAGGISYLGVFNFSRYIADGKWHHYAITFDTNADNTLTTVNVFDDYKQVAAVSQTCAGVFPYTGGHKLQLGLGSSNPPFTLGYVNSLRFTRGVLTPDKFLGRVRKGMVLMFR